MAALSRAVRGGATVAQEDEEYYRLGEYAELRFLLEVYAKAGNTDTAGQCEERISAIREELPGYAEVLDEIDKSVADAVIK